MSYLTHGDDLYEITVVSLAHEDGVAVELAKLSAGGGVLAEVRVTRDLITLVHQDSMPAEVYAWLSSEILSEAEIQADDDDWSK